MTSNIGLKDNYSLPKFGDFVFTTSGIESSEQEDYFQDMVGPYYRMAFDGSRNGRFLSDERVWLVGDFTVFESAQDGYFKMRGRFLPDRVPERLVVSFCTASHGQTVVGEDSRHWKPGDVVISNGMRPLRWHALQRTQELSIMLPGRPDFCGSGTEPDLVVLDRARASARALRLQMGLVHDACRQGDKILAHLLLNGFATVLRNLLRGLPVDPERDDVRTLRLNTILRYIDTQICDPALTPQHLCSEFGLSRAALYRMFEPIGGVADHIRNRKLDVAYARILNLPGRNENIGTVAGALGFYDHAHLSHRFKERFGITPKGLVQLEGNARRPKTTRTKKASAAGRQPLLFDLITQSYA